MTKAFDSMIHIVDDDPSVREALARVLSASGYAVRIYPSGEEFLASNSTDEAGCMLLDLELLGSSGLDLQSAMRERGDLMPVVFMSAYGDVPRTVQAIKGGASDFLVKPIETPVLLAAVESALAVDAVRRSGADAQPSPMLKLTEREQIVLRNIVAGRLNKQIAYDLELSERTIKSCRAEVMRKLGARSFAELVRISAPLLGP